MMDSCMNVWKAVSVNIRGCFMKWCVGPMISWTFYGISKTTGITTDGAFYEALENSVFQITINS